MVGTLQAREKDQPLVLDSNSSPSFALAHPLQPDECLPLAERGSLGGHVPVTQVSSRAPFHGGAKGQREGYSCQQHSVLVASSSYVSLIVSSEDISISFP